MEPEKIHSKVFCDGESGKGFQVFDAETGKGFQVSDGDRKIPIRQQKITDQVRSSYLANLKLTSNDDCTVKLMGVTAKRPDLIFIEDYESTLLDLTKAKGFQKTTWWHLSRKVGQRGEGDRTWSMTKKLQKILRQLILNTGVLIEKHINFPMEMKNIVFNAYGEQKFMNIWTENLNEEGQPISLWGRLSYIVSEIIRICEVPVDKLHHNVRDFQYMISRFDGIYKNNKADFLVGHPALLKSKQRLNFIINMRDRFHHEEPYNFPAAALDDFREWTDLVRDADFVEMTYMLESKWSLEYRESFPEHIRFACFLRNMYEHINKATETLGREKYNLRNLSLDFDELFPEFSAYLFECYVNFIVLG